MLRYYSYSKVLVSLDIGDGWIRCWFWVIIWRVLWLHGFAVGR